MMKLWNSGVVLAVVCSLTMWLTGCAPEDGYRELGDSDDVVNTDPGHHHHHHDAGPHGGHILEFGDYHGEIVFTDGVIVVFILGDDAETAVPLENAKVVLQLGEGTEVTTIDLVATPEEGETDGKSSKYSSAAGALPESVKDLEDVTGKVEVVVGDKTLSSEVSHDHDHGHDHDHHDH